MPVADLIPKDRLDAIVQRARDGGAEIVGLLKTGSAYYAPSAAAAQMVDAIHLDKRQVLPCSVRLEGEYGIRGLFTGVPCRLGAGGLVEVLEVNLTEEESAALHRSAEAVRDVVDVIDSRRDEVAAGLPSLGTGTLIGPAPSDPRPGRHLGRPVDPPGGSGPLPITAGGSGGGLSKRIPNIGPMTTSRRIVAMRVSEDRHAGVRE